MKTLTSTIIALLLTVTLAACSGSDDNAGSSSKSTTTTTEATVTTQAESTPTTGGMDTETGMNTEARYEKYKATTTAAVLTRDEAFGRAFQLCGEGGQELLNGQPLSSFPTDSILVKAYCPDREPLFNN